jgi:hypothetical protein
MRAKTAIKYFIPTLCPVLIVCLAIAFAQRRGADTQTRPRRASAASQGTITVGSGGNLQKALDAARPGDTILLEAGAVFTGTYTLPDPGPGETFVTVQGARAAELKEGERVTPAQSASMPKIMPPGRGAAALQTAPGAHHWRLVGLEIAQPTAATFVYDLVKLGDGSPAQNAPASVPHHLVIDRCYVHAARDGELKRGIALNSGQTEITNCYIAGFKVKGQEAQAAGGWNGPGPFRIVNNYVEGAGENLMFGGAPAAIPGLVPSDIEIRRNHFYKPPEWRGNYTVKNILELKNARRVVIEGNLFENCWLDAQQGYAILFTPRPNDSGAWAVVEDVRFANNIVRHVAAALHFSGQDSLYAAGPNEQRGRRITVTNNLFDDVSTAWGGDGCFLKIVSGTIEVTVAHNTILQTGNLIKAGGTPNAGFVYRDNISRHNEYGIFGDSMGYGNPAINTFFPGGVVTRNVLAKEVNAPWNADIVYPPGNMFPASLSAVGFENLAGGDYRLSAASRFRQKGTGGTDPGCDFTQLAAAMKGG